MQKNSAFSDSQCRKCGSMDTVHIPMDSALQTTSEKNASGVIETKKTCRECNSHS